MAAGWRRAALALALAAGAARAEVAVDGDASRVRDRWWGGADVALALDGAAPWRLLTLDDPPRLVVEVEGAGWRGRGPEAILEGEAVAAARFAAAPGGWGRLELTLAGPMAVEEAALAVEEGGARLALRLAPVDAATFAATAVPEAREPPLAPPPDDGRFVVAVDPGHGGIDPGAERAGVTEAALMLALGRELVVALGAAGVGAVLIRDEDVFVPLQERMTRAREAGADVLVSLHADALEEDAARGASVYTLSAEATDAASARMAERHGGADLIAGLDLGGEGDAVATALMDLARQETGPRSRRLAEAVVEALREAGAAVNGRPRREAELAVLSAADFPSVLVEVGFLSDAGDRARLADAAGRAVVVRALVAAVVAWRDGEGS